MTQRTSEFRQLYNEVVDAYWKSRNSKPGPSAYLSALWEEGTMKQIQEELDKLKNETHL
jgi:hypothetical protein